MEVCCLSVRRKWICLVSFTAFQHALAQLVYVPSWAIMPDYTGMPRAVPGFTVERTVSIIQMARLDSLWRNGGWLLVYTDSVPMKRGA